MAAECPKCEAGAVRCPRCGGELVAGDPKPELTEKSGEPLPAGEQCGNCVNFGYCSGRGDAREGQQFCGQWPAQFARRGQ
jgi:hypothetical protein